MSNRPETIQADQPVDTSLSAARRTAERLVRYLTRAVSIVLVILFAVLMLTQVLAIPVGYYWTQYKAGLVQSSPIHFSSASPSAR